jgi:uncharacterized protein with GYD domain
MALIKKYGGEFKADYALLGEVDFVVVLDLPDTERAIQVPVGLSRLLDFSFRTRRRSASTSSTSPRRSRRAE